MAHMRPCDTLYRIRYPMYDAARYRLKTLDVHFTCEQRKMYQHPEPRNILLLLSSFGTAWKYRETLKFPHLFYTWCGGHGTQRTSLTHQGNVG